MKNKFILLMSLTLILIFTFNLIGSHATALTTDDYIIGTENLNGTEENSAEVSSKLNLPEKGWKRYDDTNSNISYSYVKFTNPQWTERDIKGKYNNSDHRTYTKNALLKFNFTGSKIRIINQIDPNVDTDVTISIDNVVVHDGRLIEASKLPSSPIDTCITFEALNLSDTEHNITIKTKTTKFFNFDAIDISEDGIIKPYSNLFKLEGTNNYNNTENNSAVIGNKLKEPEVNWTRYDDSHRFITYDKTWNFRSIVNKYSETDHLSEKTPGSTLTFNFTGSKLRIISQMDDDYSSTSVTVKIDGVTDKTFSTRYDKTGFQDQSLVYEKTDLEYKTHEVTITNNTAVFFNLDCIDIDGVLLDPNEVRYPLNVTLENGITKRYNVTTSEYADFCSWFKKNNGNEQTTYAFKKTIDDTLFKEYLVFDKIEYFCIGDNFNSLRDLNKDGTEIIPKKEELSIDFVSGITKDYNISKEKSIDFFNWFTTNNGNGQVTYTFDNNVRNEKFSSYAVFDKIASFRIKE